MALLCLDIFGFCRLYTMPALGGEAMGSLFSKYLVFDTASSMPLIKFSPCSVMYSSWWLAKQEGYVPLSLEVVIE